MKVIKTENGVTLEAETPFEAECLKHIANKPLTAKFEDEWNLTGNLVLSFPNHPWDK
jgi:hypothetical protein